MPTPIFSFKTAVFQDREGRKLRLERAEVEFVDSTTARRPFRLRLMAKVTRMKSEVVEATIELSRADAYAFSEWMDAAVTGVLSKHESKTRGSKQK